MRRFLPICWFFVGPYRVCRLCKVYRCITEGCKAKVSVETFVQLVTVDPAQALEDPFFGGEYFEAYEHLEEPKMVILEE